MSGEVKTELPEKLLLRMDVKRKEAVKNEL
jgi:hypothetical protein